MRTKLPQRLTLPRCLPRHAGTQQTHAAEADTFLACSRTH